MLQRRRKPVRALVVIASATSMATLAGPSVADASSSDRPPPNCEVVVTGIQPNGEFVTTLPVCSRGKRTEPVSVDIEASGTIAVHYSGTGFQGSTFTVTGSGCNGGWLNLPSQWINVISSTYSSCAVTHFDYFYLTGDAETTYGNANLGPLNNRTNSARYS